MGERVLVTLRVELATFDVNGDLDGDVVTALVAVALVVDDDGIALLQCPYADWHPAPQYADVEPQ